MTARPFARGNGYARGHLRPGTPIPHPHLRPRTTQLIGTNVATGRTKPYAPGDTMLVTIAVILLICWALGFIVFPVGPLIHVLLVIAIVVVLIRIIQGRRPL